MNLMKHDIPGFTCNVLLKTLKYYSIYLFIPFCCIFYQLLRAITFSESLTVDIIRIVSFTTTVSLK